MRLILEGPDNAGKTTLANTLRQSLPNLLYHHPGGRPADHLEEMLCLDDQLDKMSKHTHILMDRCTAISQQVYSPNKTLQIGRDMNLTDMINAGVTFVYCRPSTDWLMSFENFTWRDGETEEFKKEIIAKQHIYIKRYDELMQWVPHLYYDYRSEEAGDMVEHLMKAISNNHDSIDFLNALKSFQVPK